MAPDLLMSRRLRVGRVAGASASAFANLFDGGMLAPGATDPPTWTTDPNVTDPNGSGLLVPIFSVPAGAGVQTGVISPDVYGPFGVPWTIEVEAIVDNVSFPAGVVNYQLYFGVTNDGSQMGGGGCIVGSGNLQGLGAFGAWTACGGAGRPFPLGTTAPMVTAGQNTIRGTGEWRQAWYRTSIPGDGVTTVQPCFQYYRTGGADPAHSLAFAIVNVTVA